MDLALDVAEVCQTIVLQGQKCLDGLFFSFHVVFEFVSDKSQSGCRPHAKIIESVISVSV